MEQVYALGVSIIEFIQYWFQDWDQYLEKVNDLSNPHFMLEVLFPLVSIVDSVFAAQLLLVLGFGGWLNAVMKWWLLEDRPYWWVQETSFYSNRRPRLLQTRQTCEPGPGSPSGHSAAGAAAILLVVMWAAHVMRDRKCYISWWKYVMYPVCGAMMASIMLARMYVAAHFPHQCLLGALIGAFLAPALCIYVSDPFIWRYGIHATLDIRSTVAWHAVSVGIIAAISALTYYSLKLCGLDPQWTVKLAFRWCERPERIHAAATPLVALAHCTASLLGWALCVTPALAQYRHYTKQRSLIIASFATGAVVYILHQLSVNVDKSNALQYYIINSVLSAVKPPLLLRLTPALAMWPYGGKNKVD